MLLCWDVEVLLCWGVEMLLCWGVEMLLCWDVEVLWCWGVEMVRWWGGEMLRCWDVMLRWCDVEVVRCWGVMLRCWDVEVLWCWYVENDVEVLRYALLMSTQHHLTISPPLLYKVSNYFHPILIMSPIFFAHWNVKVNFARSGGLRPPQHQVHSVKSCILNTTTRYKVISVIDCCGGRRPPLRE